jgi:hypothetical protein
MGSEILNHMATALNKANVAWYAAATRIFPAGTAEGDMVRRAIPTGYSSAAPAEPPAPDLQQQAEVAQ